jgi:hypothetical protein
VSVSGSTTLLTLNGGTLFLEGSNVLSAVSDIKENQNPTALISGDTEFAGNGTLTVTSGMYNSAIKVESGNVMQLTSGELTVIKTDMLGMAGGAVHAENATVKVSGGTFSGRTNSDNVSVIYASEIDVSGGSLRLQAERSPYALQAGVIAFTGGEMYAVGHSGNSSSVNQYYYERDAVSGLAGTVSGTFSPVLPFTDITVTDYYFDGVDYVYRTSRFNGTSETAFSPDASMTRAMLVTVLYRMAGSPDISGEMPFTDAVADWYRNAVIWSNQVGITAGTTATTFSPNQDVTAEQAATFLARFAKHKGYATEGSGALIRGVSDWAQDAVSWALRNEMLPENYDYSGAISRALLANAVTAFDKIK